MQRSVKSAKTNLPKRANKQQNNRSRITSTQAVGVARNFVSVTGNPQILRKESSIVVTHREYIADLESYNGGGLPSVGDSHIQSKINPANAELFPWLSSLAVNYETYKFHKLEFDYQSFCATSRQGTTIIAIDYDPSDSAPTTKVDVMSFEESVRSNVWAPVTHRCLSKNLNKKLFTSGSSSSSGNSDPGTQRSQHLGTVHVISCDGSDNSVPIGEVYVSYSVELFTPQLALSSSMMGLTLWSNLPQPFEAGYEYISERFHFTTTSATVFKFLQQVPYALLSLEQIGTGIIAGPVLTTVPGVVDILHTIVKAINVAETRAVYMAIIKSAKNGTFSVFQGTAETITNWRLDIVPMNNFQFQEFLEVVDG